MLGFFVKRLDRERSYPGADGLSTIVATASHAAWQNAREGMALPPSRDRTATKKKSLSTLFCLIPKRKEDHHDHRN